MIVLGLVLLILGWLLEVSLLATIGVILLVVGLAMLLIGHPGPLRGRWW